MHSKRKVACKTGDHAPDVDVIDVISAWIVAGGVDLNTVMREEPLGLERRNVFFSCWVHPGFSLEASVYWIQEGDQLRQYLWAELAIVRLEEPSKTAAMEFALKKSHSLPSPFKIGLNDKCLVLTLRSAVDGLRPKYLQDLINSVGPCSRKLYEELHARFDLLHLMDKLKAEDERGRIH